MSQDIESKQAEEGMAVAAPENRENPRRRLIRGAVGGAGVLLAVQARTALGQTICQSPSADFSGNTSPRPGQPAQCSGGRSPGFWKQPQKFGYWMHWIPPTFKPYVQIVDCSVSGVKNLSMNDIKTPGTLVGDVLPGATVPSGTSPSIWAILAFPTSYTEGQLMRHLIAASLNAYYFADYALRPIQIREIWTQLHTGTGTYCPDGISCAPGARWLANDVIAYISGMYDINSSIDGELCKK